MGYQVLARKWRPGKFSELVGQEHVVRAISNALDNNRLHHAYLFTGTRGVGKTTIARIFSRSLNCEKGVSSNPCGVCPACLDIEKGSYVDLIEIDAASRTKVEDTREILDNVQYRPTRGEYKVYLIDEVHMLSKHSFNALLKTLEEPPPHIKFLLATTDPQKLPITILSRCLQFNLKALTREQIGGQLNHILQAENIAYQDKALELLARSAHGSMRDALSLTDQAIAQGNGQVMSDVVSEMLGLIDADQITNLVKAILEKDKIRVLEISSELALMGTDFKAALAELMSVFHQIALTQFVPEACKLETSQARQIYTWARAVNPESVQLYYQIALQGRKDIEWAQDLKVGFEMALMRMMAFTPEAIKTDIAEFQEAGKQANEAHSQQFSAPPESLVKNTEHLTEQAASQQKKNEPESEPVTETVLDSDAEAKHQDSTDAPVVDDLIPEQTAKSVGSEQSEQRDVDSANQSLSNEMLSLMQEADDMRAEQSASQPDLQGSPELQSMEQESQPPAKVTQPPVEETLAPSQASQPITEDIPLEVEQPPEQLQSAAEDMQGQGPDFYQDYSQYEAAQDYTDYEMMQQSAEMPLQMEESHGAPPDSFTDSFAPVRNNINQESELTENDSGANTASLLSLMQTLNQATSEENKPSSVKSSDESSSDLEEEVQLPEADLGKSSTGETQAIEPEQSVPETEMLDSAKVTTSTSAPLQSSTFNYSDDLYQTGSSQSDIKSQVADEKQQQSDASPGNEEEAFFSAQSFISQQETDTPLQQEPQLPQGMEPQPGQNIESQFQSDYQTQPTHGTYSSKNESWQSDNQANTLIQEQAKQVAVQDTSSFQPQSTEQDYSYDNRFPANEGGGSAGHEMSIEDQESQPAALEDDLNAYSQMAASQENSHSQQAHQIDRHQVNGQTPEEEYLATDTTMSVDFEIPFAIDGKKVTKASQLDTWSQLIERAGLGGLTKQLALNSNYFNNGENVKLVVSETQTHLLSENTIRTIEESISGAIQQPIKVDANIGEVIDTPAAVQKAINTMRQQHAVKTINEDSAVTDICQSFSGTVLQDTIKPR